jgi:hypothetical protein
MPTAWPTPPAALVPAGSLLDTLGILSCEFDAVLSGVRESVCAELLPALRELEVLSRKVLAAQVELDAAVADAGLRGEHGYATTRTMLADVHRLAPREKMARQDRQEQIATRRSLTGEVLPPRLPATAAALAEGAISAGHVEVIAQVMRSERSLAARQGDAPRRRAGRRRASGPRIRGPARLRRGTPPRDSHDGPGGPEAQPARRPTRCRPDAAPEDRVDVRLRRRDRPRRPGRPSQPLDLGRSRRTLNAALPAGRPGRRVLRDARLRPPHQLV